MSLSAQNTLPQVDVKTLQGKPLLLQNLVEESSFTLISFWASWCSPCKKELDAIALRYPAWKEKFDLQVVAISINNRRAVGKLPAMVKSKDWPYTILIANEEEMRKAFNFQTIPQTFIVNRQGKIVYAHNGYVPGDEVALEKKFTSLTK